MTQLGSFCKEDYYGKWAIKAASLFLCLSEKREGCYRGGLEGELEKKGGGREEDTYTRTRKGVVHTSLTPPTPVNVFQNKNKNARQRPSSDAPPWRLCAWPAQRVVSNDNKLTCACSPHPRSSILSILFIVGGSAAGPFVV